MSRTETSERSWLEPDDYTLSLEQLEIAVSRHAVIRYQERLRPALGFEVAQVDLLRLIKLGIVTSRPPTWLGERQRQRAAFYLIVGDVVLPLDPCRRDRSRLIALTCLARGGISENARVLRNQSRRRRGDTHTPITHHPRREFT